MPAYFTGKGYGVSNLTDIEGFPLLSWYDPNTKQTITCFDRAAVKFDPTIKAPHTLDEIYNTRVVVKTSSALKKAVGGTSAQELDHIIPLELGGSNEIANLGLDTNTPGTSNNPTDAYENALSAAVQAGSMSLQDAWFAIANAKGKVLAEKLTMRGNSAWATAAQSALGAIYGLIAKKTAKTLNTNLLAQIKQDGDQLAAKPYDLPTRTKIFTEQINLTAEQLNLSTTDAAAYMKVFTTQYAQATSTNPTELVAAMTANEQRIIGISNTDPNMLGISITAWTNVAAALTIGQGVVVIAGTIAFIAAIYFGTPVEVAAAGGGGALATLAGWLGVTVSTSTVAIATTTFVLYEALGAISTRIPMMTKQAMDSGWVVPSLINTALKNDAGIVGSGAGAAATSKAGKAALTQTYPPGVTSNTITPQPTTDAFSTWLAQQNIPFPELTPAKLADLHTQFSALAAPATVSTPSSAPTTPTAPYNAPRGQVLITGISSGVVGNAEAFTPRPFDLIENDTDLTTAAQNNLHAFLTAFPSVIGYDITLAPHVIADDGSVRFGGKQRVVKGYTTKGKAEYKTVQTKFAVLEVYFVPSPRKRVMLDKITLGPVDEANYQPKEGDIAAIVSHLTANFVSTSLHSPSTSSPPGLPISPAIPTGAPGTGINPTAQEASNTQLQLAPKAPAPCLATTLADFFSAQGLPLPNIVARSALYEQAGLGTAETYVTTAEQNTKLLQHLQAALGCFVSAPTSQQTAAAGAAANTPAPQSAPIPVPTAAQLAARLNPTPSHIVIPSAGLYRALGDNGDAVYYFDDNGVPAAYGIVPPGAPRSNDYQANIAYLATFGIDWNSLPTFNRADIDQHLIAEGRIAPNGVAIYNPGGSLAELATLVGSK